MSSLACNEVILERVEETNEVLKYADESRKEQIHTDVCIKAQEKSFQAHRLILSSYSGYFRTMFQTDMIEKYNDTVKIEGVDATSLESLIDFIYTGKICISRENVFELFTASDYLQIDEATELCFDYWSYSLSVEIWFDSLTAANLYQNDMLLRRLFRFFNKKFAEISSSNDFKSQSKENVLHLLSQRYSSSVKERLAYFAIIGWVKYEERRKDDFAELFQILDISKFSLSFLRKTVLTETLVIENELCSSLVVNALVVKSREPITNNEILCVGQTNRCNKIFVVYNNDEGVYPALPEEYCCRFALKFDNFVYCIMGEKDCDEANKVLRMKLYEANMKWEEVASMELKRTDFAAAVYRDGIVVAGGSRFVEFYNPSLNRWLALPSMNEERSLHALVTCNGCLYCLGGCDDDEDEWNMDCHALSSVEMLNDVNGSWQHVQPMQRRRNQFAAVNCMDAIYAIGGSNGRYITMKDVEKYDPNSNKWVFVKDMNIERFAHSACVMQDKIYVVGGQDANNHFVSEIECYDPLNDNWSIVERTIEQLHGYFTVAV